ncbi:MAG: RagB/SusD family nutrient uptake outer membrane protein [Saprospiraceae bacterium]|nr:RagB/SusD family nutrient uptake outer membrane protein [Saprospiraceae bacterium]
MLDAGGDNIKIKKAGGYELRLDLTKPDYSYEFRLTGFDRRGSFYSNGQKVDIDDLTLFTDGYAVNKFRNVTSTGAKGKDSDFPDTDFPMFRLGDVYLMASEAIFRGAGGGDKAKAVAYFNKVRERAYKGSAGNIIESDLNLNLILDERARELYWECHRRTDLVRFGQFTDGSYLWQWKGGVKEGANVPSYRNIFPIPSADINANPNLKQNPGY